MMKMREAKLEWFLGRKERYRLEFHWASEKLITQLVRTMGRTLKKLSISKQVWIQKEKI
jgi:hypothetical protein